MNPNTQELKQIQAYLQTQGKQSINQSELKSEQSSKKPYLPWILGGVGVISLIGIVVYFVMRKKRREE